MTGSNSFFRRVQVEDCSLAHFRLNSLSLGASVNICASPRTVPRNSPGSSQTPHHSRICPEALARTPFLRRHCFVPVEVLFTASCARPCRTATTTGELNDYKASLSSAGPGRKTFYLVKELLPVFFEFNPSQVFEEILRYSGPQVQTAWSPY
jgi:hypothetical protein